MTVTKRGVLLTKATPIRLVVVMEVLEKVSDLHQCHWPSCESGRPFYIPVYSFYEPILRKVFWWHVGV